MNDILYFYSLTRTMACAMDEWHIIFLFINQDYGMWNGCMTYYISIHYPGLWHVQWMNDILYFYILSRTMACEMDEWHIIFLFINQDLWQVQWMNDILYFYLLTRTMACEMDEWHIIFLFINQDYGMWNGWMAYYISIY